MKLLQIANIKFKIFGCTIIGLTILSCQKSEICEFSNEDFPTISLSNEFEMADNQWVIAEHKSGSASFKINKNNSYYNLKTKKKDALWGRKKYTAAQVTDSASFKNYANINILEQLLQEEMMIGLKSKFINVKVDKKTQCYFFQESFDKRLIENNNAREGVLFVNNGKVKIKHCLNNNRRKSIAASINEKILKWSNGKTPTKRVFDIEKSSKFIALYKAFNIKELAVAYYLNPVSNLIEPFAFLGSNNKDDLLYDKLSNDKAILAGLIKFKKTDFDVADKVKNHPLAKHLNIQNWDNELVVENIQNDHFKPTKSLLKYFKDTNGVYQLSKINTVINEHITFPEGAKLVLKPGESIDLIKGASIVCYNQIEFKGNKVRPIRVFSSDGSGQGIHVINAKKGSVLRYVLFQNLCALDKQEWTLPSAVTFCQSPVEISNCSFVNANAEDALNLFRSEFQLTGSKFINSQSDAFDADFCSGVLSNCEFKDVYNDGVDASGSKIIVNDCNFNRVGDKAISAGEKSEIKSSGVHITGASLAFSSKDKSTISVKNTKVDKVDVLYTIFKKKTEYGSANIIAKNVQASNFKEHQLIEEGSSLIVDGEKIHMYIDDVQKYLYGKEYGR